MRVKCSNCEQAAVKAESYGDCGTYLKILYQEKDPQVEAVADDLASLVKKALAAAALIHSYLQRNNGGF